MFLEIVLRGRDEFCLFAAINTFCTTTIIRSTAETNLHKNKGFFISHNKVDFSAPATVIGCNKFKPPRDQEIAREVLGSLPDFPGIRGSEAVH